MTVKGDCPVHGLQEFIRVEQMAWWECPGLRRDEGCQSVVLDEHVTVDGGEVVQYLDWAFQKVMRS